MRESRSDGRSDEDESRDEDRAASTDEIVERVREPSADKRRGNVGRRVDQAYNPLIALSIRVAGDVERNSKLGRKAEVCAVRLMVDEHDNSERSKTISVCSLRRI